MYYLSFSSVYFVVIDVNDLYFQVGSDFFFFFRVQIVVIYSDF